jgi:hypothetical protein
MPKEEYMSKKKLYKAVEYIKKNYNKRYYPNAMLGQEEEHYIIINPSEFYDRLVLFNSSN